MSCTKWVLKILRKGTDLKENSTRLSSAKQKREVQKKVYYSSPIRQLSTEIQ